LPMGSRSLPLIVDECDHDLNLWSSSASMPDRRMLAFAERGQNTHWPSGESHRLPEFPVLTSQSLRSLSSLCPHTSTSATVDLGLLDPIMQRLRRAADLGRNRAYRRPAGGMLALVLQYHPDRPLTDFRRKHVRRLAHHGSTFSRVGASGNSGAVQVLRPARPASLRAVPVARGH
jgi:hypothetical protein